jgi:antitoxin ParD1/3/4
MNIQLTPRSQRVLERHIASGEFKTPEEVVERALELLDVTESTPKSLRAKIQEGLEDVAAGRVVELDGDDAVHEFFEKIIRQGHERLANGQAHSS